VKFISFILSLYLLALAIVPCCLYDNCPEDKAKTEQTTNHNSGDDDGCGTCSPFFNCEGCLSVSNVSEPIIFTPNIILAGDNTYTSLVQSFLSYDFHSIWQPPQLV
jgi:hypothetical protein